MNQTANFKPPRPTPEWRSDRPPAGEKVESLTCYGVRTIGPVSRDEWDRGFIVCWHRCPSKPLNWDELLEAAHKRGEAHGRK